MSMSGVVLPVKADEDGTAAVLDGDSWLSCSSSVVDSDSWLSLLPSAVDSDS